MEQPGSVWGRVSKEFLLADGQGWGEGRELMMEDGRNHKVRIRRMHDIIHQMTLELSFELTHACMSSSSS